MQSFFIKPNIGTRIGKDSQILPIRCFYRYCQKSARSDVRSDHRLILKSNALDFDSIFDWRNKELLVLITAAVCHSQLSHTFFGGSKRKDSDGDSDSTGDRVRGGETSSAADMPESNINSQNPNPGPGKFTISEIECNRDDSALAKSKRDTIKTLKLSKNRALLHSKRGTKPKSFRGRCPLDPRLDPRPWTAALHSLHSLRSALKLSCLQPWFGRSVFQGRPNLEALF